MTDRKLMQQALEALIKAHPYSNSNKDLDGHSEAIAALGERLAQPEPLQRFTDVQQEIEAALTPEQDPVAYVLRTLSSKSISDEIAPTGWSTFEARWRSYAPILGYRTVLLRLFRFTPPHNSANGKD